MVSTTRKAFTLVELIVVITILAILGTIAFISLQGYSADARNSKRTQDLNNLASQINIRTTEGAPLSSFAATGNEMDGTNDSIAGTGTTTDDYRAGVPNYTALNVKSEDFQDPNGSEYRIGVTTKKDGEFELASIFENGSGTNTAKVNGTYNARGSGSLTLASTGTTTAVILADSDIGKIKRGDYISDGSDTGLVTRVSADGKTLTLNVATFTGATTINLLAPEQAGLVESTTAGTAVVNDGTDLPY